VRPSLPLVSLALPTLSCNVLKLYLSHSHNTAALRDVDVVLTSTPHDVLALSLRASLRGVSGDAKAAQADLAATNAAVRSGKAYRSRLGDADADLEYLARGWAYCHVRRSLSLALSALLSYAPS